MNTTLKAVDILKGVKDILCVPERWTQGVSARDAEGYSVPAKSADATCWCLTGAMQLIIPNGDEYLPTWALGVEVMQKGIDPDLPQFCSIALWNDFKTTKYSDVMALLDKLIAVEQAKASEAKEKLS